MQNNVKVVLTGGEVKFYNGDEEFSSMEEAFMGKKTPQPDFITVRTDILVNLYKEAKACCEGLVIDESCKASYNRGIMHTIERILPNVESI
jgi:hypothetical protein